MGYYYTTKTSSHGLQLNMLNDRDVTFNSGDHSVIRTVFTDNLPTMEPERVYSLNKLLRFNAKYAGMMKLERSRLYRHYSIPKRSGGMRPIDDPCDELRTALTELKEIVNEFTVGYHTCAAAYIEGRSTISAVKRLMSIRPNNILHLDLHSFFPSTTPAFVMQQIQKVYPFAIWCQHEDYKAALEKALSLAFLNDGMPQGTNISPFLSNIMMVEFDHQMNRYAKNNNCVYVRYADDIYLSCYGEISVSTVKQLVRGLLRDSNAAFTLNEEKTKLLRIGGPCFVLGISIGADKKMSIGSEKKRFAKAMINNFCYGIANGATYTQEEAMELQGNLAYWREIEPEYFDELIIKFGNKYNINVKSELSRLIRG